MSFRTRLTVFFLIIVMLPMTVIGILVVRLIDDSRSGKAQARANGLASVAASVYGEASRTASYDARSVARLLGTADGSTLRMRGRRAGHAGRDRSREADRTRPGARRRG